MVGSMMAACGWEAAAQADDKLFQDRVVPILARRCLSCHDDTLRKGDLSLRTKADLDELGYVSAGDPDDSYLIELITPNAGSATMPKDADPLKPEEIEIIRTWIAEGGVWPNDVVVDPPQVTDRDWWSLRPLVRPAVPAVPLRVRQADGQISDSIAGPHNEIDQFIAEQHQARGLSFAPAAPRAVLIRRLYFDLLGLPPTPEQIEQFANDPAPDAYERLVDELLASPHYGERWARHWLDVVHYGDTHGYDKDQPRPNAWPYRDYVIRALNSDKPWSRFIEEQLAGDVLHPGTRDGIEALGFIAAGPWDLVGHAEVPETKYDGKVARHLDRDDMVRTAIQSFNSLTIGCAQCHNHKFDPITQADYYSLQAVFAALDRADKPYDLDPAVAERRAAVQSERNRLAERQAVLEKVIQERAGAALTDLDAEIAEQERLAAESGDLNATPSYGYHSEISATPEAVKWVQVDLGASVPLDQVVLRPAFDQFNNIGAGFGFPVRWRLEISDDPIFESNVILLASHEADDFANPGTQAVVCPVQNSAARYVRLTATRLAPRQNDSIFALAELEALDSQGNNRARGCAVTSLDSIEAPPRWSRGNLTDGNFPRVNNKGAEGEQPHERKSLPDLRRQREELRRAQITDAERSEWDQLDQRQRELDQSLKALPPANLVFAGTVHRGSGTFVGTGAQGGTPRPIFLLARGDVAKPGPAVGPGTLRVFPSLPSRFDLPDGHREGDRRAALARWLTAPENALTWRSIVNRVWQNHFGRGLVDTPDDFGHMGAVPTHPELLDWLAIEFRDGGQSLKSLHRKIVLSHTYRQSSVVSHAEQAVLSRALAEDVDNRYLWRMTRRRLDAEAVRDSVLAVTGKLDLTMGGPAFRDFVLERPEHSPHYEYHLHDPEDPASHRRSIYRFIVRSQLQPFMTVMDCADPSMQVGRRNESLTPLQALALLNDGLIVTMSKHFAVKLEQSGGTLSEQLEQGFYESTGRRPTSSELTGLTTFAERHGLPNACRVLLNLNEFLFID